MRPPPLLFLWRGNIGFNPRTHEGCDCDKPIIRGVYCSFNPRTHEGCDLSSMRMMTMTDGFNPRTHEGCDRIYQVHANGFRRFQSTHPRGVRLVTSPLATLSCSVSIHAPTRGATSRWASTSTAHTCFNPRTHEGCDIRQLSEVYNKRVSIHAPTRGATSGLIRNPSRASFQSTHPRGVRLGVGVAVEGVEKVSIHAPTRGATGIAFASHLLGLVSIHAPTRGATYDYAKVLHQG